MANRASSTAPIQPKSSATRMKSGWSSHPAIDTMTTARISEPGESVVTPGISADGDAEHDEPHEEVDDAGARRLPLGALGVDGVGERVVAAPVEPRRRHRVPDEEEDDDGDGEPGEARHPLDVELGTEVEGVQLLGDEDEA